MYIHYNLQLTNYATQFLDLYMQRHIKTYYNINEDFVYEI